MQKNQRAYFGALLAMWFLFACLLPIQAFSVVNPAFRLTRYGETTPEKIRIFYMNNHANQTFGFTADKKNQYLPPRHLKMSIWDAMKLVETLVDDSSAQPSSSLSSHYFQTAEALRKDGHPRWLILTGLIYDLGKVLAFYGEPPWAIQGDTYPVGCPFSNKIVFSSYFKFNSDQHVDEYQKPHGIYAPNLGLDQVSMAWGQDEYLYHVLKKYLPEQSAYIIRYRSFYAYHREGAYQYLLDDKDWEMLPLLQLFVQYETCARKSIPIDIEKLRAYYEGLVQEFFPAAIDW